MKPHKHAEIIKSWADGAEIEAKNQDGNWYLVKPTWREDQEYRIKPEEKKPVVRWLWAYTVVDEWRCSNLFMSDAEANKYRSAVGHKHKKLEYTRTEFEE